MAWLLDLGLDNKPGGHEGMIPFMNVACTE